MREAAALEEVTAGYPGTTVLRRASLHIPRGSLTALLGPNGSGKTTILKLLAGLLRPRQGRVRVLGHDPYREIARITREIYYLHDRETIPRTITVKDALEAMKQLYNPDLVDEYTHTLQLDQHLHKRVGSLSLGYRMRLHILEALASNRPLLLLDEPFRGLDTASRTKIAETINAAAKRNPSQTIIIATHILSKLNPTTIAIVEEGSIRYTGTLRDAPLTGCILLECPQGTRIECSHEITIPPGCKPLKAIC